MKTNFSRFLFTLKEWLFPKEEMIKGQSAKKTRTIPVYKMEQNIEVRVVHQYPKQGNFRFPVIKDNETVGQTKERTSRAKTSNATHLIEEEKVVRKQPFQGKISPSPIYGYRNPPTKPTHKSVEIVRNESTETTLPLLNTYEPSEYRREEEFEEEIAVSMEEVTISSIEEDNQMDEMECSTVREEEVSSSIKEENNIPRWERRRLERLQKRVEKGHDRNNVAPFPPKLEQTNTKNKEVEKITNMKSSPLPYNVVMLSKDKQKETKRVDQEKTGYSFPSLHLLNVPQKNAGINDEWVTSQVKKLDETLDYFNIKANVVHVTKGPSVTRFEIQPQPGVKVSKITNLTDDLKLNLAAKEIRMEAPIPGKNTIGIEVPNDVSEAVFLRDILHHPNFLRGDSPLTVALGKDIEGEPVVTDLQKMPHGLIAGATGSGKSVCVNSILISLLYKATPKDVRLLLIDPKMVELAPYNGMPHLASPVITDPKEATEGLKWAVSEMDRRYELFAREGTRDLKRYNEKMVLKGQRDNTLPYLVIVVDELADLMMVAPNDVEEAICRIAQKARACGIHLLVATQRPSVDVITGLIKANIPTRIAFSVSSQADSRTILDGAGAERLLGKGDMLFLENGSGKPVRIQGTFVSDEEIDRIMDHVKKLQKPSFLFEREALQLQISESSEDDLFEPACQFVAEQQGASASLLQRHFRIGYNRAARLMDEMEERGIISSANGSKPREVYLTKDEINGKMNNRGEI